MHSHYNAPSHFPQEKNSSDGMMTGHQILLAGYADTFGPLTIYEMAQLTDAQWENGETEPEYWCPEEPEPDYSGMTFEEQYGMTREEFHLALEAERAKVPHPPETNVVYLPTPARQEPYIKKPIHAKLRWAVFRRDGYRCVICGCDEDLAADHILPEARGGKATIGNLQTLCKPCNSRKGAR